MVYNLFFTPFRYLHVLYSHDGKPRGTVVFGIISFVTKKITFVTKGPFCNKHRTWSGVAETDISFAANWLRALFVTDYFVAFRSVISY